MDSSTPAPPGSTSPLPPGATLAEQLRQGGTVLVAAKEGPASAASVLVAAALGRRYGAAVEAIQVLDITNAALPAPLPGIFTLARTLIGDEPYAADALARRHEFTALLGEPNEWPVHIALGTPAQEILRYAERQGIALIVMGLRRHSLADRVFRDETTLTVARRARAMVLAVVPELRGLPRTAVVGVDFGPASVRAARAALDVLAQPAEGASASLILAHVDPHPADPPREGTAGGELVRRLGVAAAFEQLVRELNAPSTVKVESTVLRGAAAQRLVEFAAERSAELIAVGSQRHERLDRWILGSVTTEIVRDGRCSVLVIPPRRRD
jgi:nucleotide-binding universal stress UspA family protein